MIEFCVFYFGRRIDSSSKHDRKDTNDSDGAMKSNLNVWVTNETSDRN